MDKPNIPEIARFFRRLKTTQEVQEHKIADSETWSAYWLEEVQKASDEDLQEKIQELITIGLGPNSLPQLLQGQRCARRNNAIFKSLMEHKDVQRLIAKGQIRVEKDSPWGGMVERFIVHLGANAPRPPDSATALSLIPAAPLPPKSGKAPMELGSGGSTVALAPARPFYLRCVCPTDNERVFLETMFFWHRAGAEGAEAKEAPFPYGRDLQGTNRFKDLEDFVQELHRLIHWASPPLPKWQRKPRGRRRYAWRLKMAATRPFLL